MSSYDVRIIDAELDELMSALPALSIDGPKGVGKTVTASRRATKIFPLDNNSVVQTFEASSQPFDDQPNGTILVDEWQRVPHSWDLVRRAVDGGAPPGRFLLTGSAYPVGAQIHSGAGRIVSLRMRPLSLAERNITEPTVSLSALLTRSAEHTAPSTEIVGHTDVKFEDYVQEITASGFPGIRELSHRAHRTQMRSYIERIVNYEFAELGVRVRRNETLLAWMRAYAAATASTASYSTISDAATSAQGNKPAKETTMVYRDVLAQLWLHDPVSAWLPLGREFAPIRFGTETFFGRPGSCNPAS